MTIDDQTISKAMSILGSRTSERKAEAARKNSIAGGEATRRKWAGNSHDRRKAKRNASRQRERKS